MLLHYHLAKTGGSSLRTSGLTYFGKENCETIYAKGSATTSKKAGAVYYADMDKLKQVERAQRLVEFLLETRPKFFSSHMVQGIRRFLPDDAQAQGIHTIAVFREPVARLISHYNYYRRKGHFKGSFEDFYQAEEFRNWQAKRFSIAQVDQLSFVGLSEQFDETLSAVNRALNIQLAPVVSNKTPFFSRNVKRRKLSDAVLTQLQELNSEDYAVYEHVKKRFEAQKQTEF